MTKSQFIQGETVLQHQVSSILLAAILSLTVAMPLMARATDTKPADGEALLENQPWIGDFDQMAEKRQIRVLVAFSKTFYFLDRGRQRGISYDLLKEFEKFVNKKLFAFASYNTGPAKVNRLRKKTAAMGLNPNVWFDNVEIAAALVIGRETVQYVSNIYNTISPTGWSQNKEKESKS